MFHLNPRHIVTAFLSLMLLCFLSAVALAAGADPNSAPGLVEEGYNAVVHKEWWLLAGVILSGVVLLARKIGPFKALFGGGDELLSEHAKDVRGFFGVVVLAVAGGIGHALLASGGEVSAINTELVLAILKVLGAAFTTFLTATKGVKLFKTDPATAAGPPF